MNYLFFFYIFFNLTLTEARVSSDRIDSFVFDGNKKLKVKIIPRLLNEEKDLTVLGFKIEKASLAEIQAQLGEAPILRTGDAANSNASICFTNSVDQSLIFSSDEMGGGTILTRIEVSSPQELARKDCYVNSKAFKSAIGTARGIKLLISKNEVLSFLGQPSVKRNEDDWEYIYQAKEKSDICKSGYDVTGSYRIKFRLNKVMSFYVTHGHSC